MSSCLQVHSFAWTERGFRVGLWIVPRGHLPPSLFWFLQAQSPCRQWQECSNSESGCKCLSQWAEENGKFDKSRHTKSDSDHVSHSQRNSGYSRLQKAHRRLQKHVAGCRSMSSSCSPLPQEQRWPLNSGRSWPHGGILRQKQSTWRGGVNSRGRVNDLSPGLTKWMDWADFMERLLNSSRTTQIWENFSGTSS